MAPEVVVLRYGHRDVRDYRITGHVCLVARAFGANKVIVHGSEDKSIRKSIEEVVKRWGGDFKIEFTNSWTDVLQKAKKEGFGVVHAAMYGLPLQKVEKKIRSHKKLLVIVGSQKVEGRVYELSDYNVSVTLQPHSEVAALAIILDRIFEGRELGKKFKDARIRIKPQARGKRVEKSETQ